MTSLYTFRLATKIICDCHGFSIVSSENVKYVTSQEIIHSESDVKPKLCTYHHIVGQLHVQANTNKMYTLF